LLTRTRQKILFKLKSSIFETGRFQKMLDTRDKMRLEDMMGFRGQFDEHRRFQFALLKERGLLPSHKFLEIGCGPLTGGIPVIEYLDPGNYVGIDVRNSVLDLAWKEIGKAGLSYKNPRLICSPSFGSRQLGSERFDFVLSFSVLFHMNDQILQTYFAALRHRLAAGGQGLANVTTLVDTSSTWLEFPFLPRTIEEYRELAASKGLETSVLGEMQDFGFRLDVLEKRNQLLQFRHAPSLAAAPHKARDGSATTQSPLS
jgi:SAM-dependent methyltransferase